MKSSITDQPSILGTSVLKRGAKELTIVLCLIYLIVNSAFAGARVSKCVVPVTRSISTPRMEFEMSEGEAFDVNPIVIVLAMVGWVVPSSIPTSIPLTEGTGLSQAFLGSMQSNLANWPKGPGLDDPFWLLLVLWHIGLFACLIFGTIGYNLSKMEKE